MGTYKTVYRILEMNIHNFTYRIIDTKTKKHCSKDGNDNDNDDNNAEQQEEDSYYPYQPKNNSRARCSKSMHVNSIINMQVKKKKAKKQQECKRILLLLLMLLLLRLLRLLRLII